ncbi:MAG: FHA domain-containing protein [Anaerolineaceae bacterium]|nr:MAG: FHA domain-containing protein [Anaerolineaceae bacterium]
MRKSIQVDGDIHISLAGEDAEDWTLQAPRVEGYVIGRSDPDSEYAPDIDLTPHHGLDYGISRRHAALVAYRGVVHVVDLGSMNGTYINGERLSVNSAYPLHEGDRLSIANLDLLII